MIDVDEAIAYINFVCERHRIWERRMAGVSQPWTEDPILATQKFTNTFRVLDYGSQFLLKDGFLDGEPRDVLMRCFLYRHTGRVDSWRHLYLDMGRWPEVADLDDVLDWWKGWRDEGNSIFTAAYLVYPQSSTRGTDKLESIVYLTQRLFDPLDESPMVDDFLAAQTQEERFAVLRRNKGVADFMSMQVLTDWGYSEHCGVDRENEFVVLGPGARRGAAALDSANPALTLRWAAEAVWNAPDCPVLGTRRPSLMDIQNTFCEWSKYVRFRSRPSREKPYVPAHPEVQSTPVLLPKHFL